MDAKQLLESAQFEILSTLKPTDFVTDNKLTQKIYGSLKIKQNDQGAEASDLHYKVGTAWIFSAATPELTGSVQPADDL